MGQLLSGYAAATSMLYEINLRQWFGWCEERKVQVLEAQQEDVEEYRDWLLSDKKLKAASVTNKLNSLAAYYRYAVTCGAATHDPVSFVRRPSVPRVSSAQALDRGQLDLCLDLALKAGEQYYVVWALMGLVGLRVGQVIALNVEHFRTTKRTDTLLLEAPHCGVPSALELSDDLYMCVSRLRTGRSSGPLLRITQGPGKGARMDRKAASRLVSSICQRAGISARITPNSLRHTFLNLALTAGVDPSDLSTLGVTSPRTIPYHLRGKNLQGNDAVNAVAKYVLGSSGSAASDDLISSGRYAASICEGGHFSNPRIQSRHQYSAAHCSKCGARILSKCPTCGSRLLGWFVGKTNSPADPDRFCVGCGFKFPWTDRPATLEELDLQPIFAPTKSIRIVNGQAFYLCPFGEPFDAIYGDHIVPALNDTGVKVIRADEIYSTNSIIDDIWHGIFSSQFVVADVTTKNPNVMYEIGLAHAIGRPTVIVSQDIADVPFDLRHRRCIIYSHTPRGCRKLVEDLTATVAAIRSMC